MATLRLFRMVAMLLATALLALPALTVGAASDRVTHTTIQDHNELTVMNGDDFGDGPITWACDFRVRVIWEGRVKISVYSDKAGNWIKTVQQFDNYRITFANDANGKAISTIISNTFYVTPGPEPGTWIIAYNGIGGRLVIPGEGAVKSAMDVGRLVQLVYGDYPSVITLFASAQFNQTGDPNDDPWPTVCRVLA